MTHGCDALLARRRKLVGMGIGLNCGNKHFATRSAFRTTSIENHTMERGGVTDGVRALRHPSSSAEHTTVHKEHTPRLIAGHYNDLWRRTHRDT